jgi:molybdate transport system ATP-binding protein
VLSRPDLSLSLGHEAGVVLDGTVEEHVAGYELTRIRTGAGELLAHGTHGAAGRAIRLRVLARDVSLALKPAEGTTILNILPATIESLHERAGGSVDVVLRAGGERLMARISRKSRDALALTAGTSCYAQLKGLAIKSVE